MTTLAVIGDVHAHFERLARVLARIDEVGVDGVLLVGDLGSHDVGLARLRTPEGDARYRASLDDLFGRVEALGVPWAFVPGNHDLPAIDHPRNVDGSVASVAGLEVAGIGGAGPQRFGFAYEWDEDDVRRRELPPCDVLLVHAPPRDTALDRVPFKDEHVGSAAIRERAESHHGFLVCGHIHESPGGVQLGGCLCLNAGGLGEPFGRAQVGFLRQTGDTDEVWHEDLDRGTVRRWTRRA